MIQHPEYFRVTFQTMAGTFQMILAPASDCITLLRISLLRSRKFCW